MHSDTGFERHSARDTRLRQFVADGPGWAGYKLDVDPEVDGDAAAQFLAGADRARIEETDLAVDSHRPCELSLEALAGLGVEFADTVAKEDDEFESEADDEDDGYPDEDVEQPPEGIIRLFRDGEYMEIRPALGRRSKGKLYQELVIEPQVRAMRLVSRVLTAAKPESAKGNGNGHKPATPPVGKFLTGQVVDHGPKGMLVELPNGTEVRIAVADEFGHGSQTKALQWLHSHTVGQKVRLRVQYVNGAVYGVLTREKHPRPWQCRQPIIGKEVEARPAN